MALPPKVIEQLAREPAQTPGWSGRLMMFAATLFILNLVGYFGLTLGYSKYLNGQIRDVDREIKSQSQQIPEEERGAIVAFFSQLSNLRLILDNHVAASSFFNLLETTTHRNVYYTRLAFNSEKDEVILTGMATSVADVTEQVKIFQGRTEIEKISLGNINNTGSGWQFDVTLGLAPDFLSSVSASGLPAQAGGAAAPTSTATSTPTSTPKR